MREASFICDKYPANYCDQQCCYELNPDTRFYLLTMLLQIFFSKGGSWDGEALDRSCQGILAVLLSLKKCPLIRYQQSSEMAQRFAENIKVRTVMESLFDLITIILSK